VANTFPVVQPSRLDSLAHLLNFTNKAEHDVLCLETKSFRLFRQFLALKVAIPFAFVDGIHWPLSVKTSAVLFVIVASWLPRFYFPGLVIILGLSLYESWSSWPFSINHGGLEFGILLLICLVPDHESKPSRITCADMVKILFLSVWFFSGIHKLVDGYYLNGEFFALEALSNQTRLGHSLNQVISFFAPFFGQVALAPLACCMTAVFEFPQWQANSMLVLSWLTIIMEISLPILMLAPRFRSIGIVGFFVTQGTIAYFSGEIDFAFTAFAILFLFIPKFSRFTYPSLACIFLLVQPWT
jgi:hypothetical protein